jgi:lipoprotein-releasing system permease protein
LNFLFAWRYFKAKKSANAINIIAWISIIAIVVGTAALILVLSVYGGFEGLVKSLYSSFYTDLRISPASSKVMVITPQQLQQLRGFKRIANFSTIVEEKALIQNDDFQSLIYLKGVDDNYRYTAGVADNLISGKFNIGTADAPKLVVGVGVEAAIGIYADNNPFPLKIYLPRKSSGPQLNAMEDISSDTIGSSASFMIQQDFDNKYGITNIDFVKRILRMGADEYTAVEIKVKDPDEADDVKKEIQKLLGNKYLVQSRYEQNRSLYSIMTTERWVIYAVLCLILTVAAFNIIGALTMLVLEKQKDISVLHAMGANKTFIQNIFLSEGLLLGIIGAIIGMILAFLLAIIQQKFHLIKMQGGTFLIDYYPVKLKLSDFVIVSITVVIVALLASWVPARQAARQEFNLRGE